MTNESREQILSEFQSYTGLENLEECIYILNQHQWNLQNAVQEIFDRIGTANDSESTVPSDLITEPLSTSVENKVNPTNKRQTDSDEFDDANDLRVVKTISGQQRFTTTNRGPVRDLNFTVEYCDQTVKVTVADNETIQQLKTKIFEAVKVPVHQQNFLNWMDKSYQDQTLLKDLYLPKENEIHLSSMPNGIVSHPITTATSEMSHDYPLSIQYADRTGKNISLNLVFKPTTIIREIKEKIERDTGVSVDQQLWTGLFGAQDTDQLRQTKIPLRSNLLVREQVSVLKRDTPRSTVSVPRSDDDPMEIDHEIIVDHGDDYDDITVPSGSATIATNMGSILSGQEPLIPDGCDDDSIALEHFARVFHRRYGSTGPILFIGSLDQAIQESLYTSIDNRRPLAVYLHNDKSVCANVFCSQILAAESIVEYLANNYVFWAWDLTLESNEHRLAETLRRCVGSQCSQRIATAESDSFPLLLVLSRTRGTLELLEVIEGKSTPSEVISSLIQAHESFDQQRLRDSEEEILREKREELKRQQEDEYRRSLAADLEKERQRQDDERKQREEQDEEKRRQQQRLQQQQESQARLPAEPSETEPNITRFKIRLPDDEGVLMRRFRVTDNLQVLFDYLTSQGRMAGEYKLLTTYPKRDLTTLDVKDTFEQLKLYPQEQLILESL